MTPKWEVKNWENLTLGPLGGQGGPQGPPKAPTGPPKHPKWSPRHPQSPQNGVQEGPRDPKMVPKRPPELPKWRPRGTQTPKMAPQAPKICTRTPHERTNTQTDAKTTTQQPTKQTTQIGGMREAIRRPTWDGVLDPTLELLAPAFDPCRNSLPEFGLVPLHNPPQGPRAFRRADPFEVGPARVFFKKTHPKIHSIFEGIFAPKIVPKASQNDAKI